MSPVKVLVVEDEHLFREMLAITLSTDPEIQIVASYSNAADVLADLDTLSFNVAILDIQLGGEMNGHELGMQLRRLRPEVGIVLLSNFLEFAFLNALRRRRMSGWSYLLKDSVTDVATLQRAVKGTARGDIVLDSRVTAHLQARRESRVAALTEREREILSLIAEGYNNRAIADKVNITTKSVENTVNRVFHKMEINRNGDLQPRVAAVLTYLRETRAR
ncbi:MAG: response regulator transcription factor [Firmicutes bacterium]|nr:response regulator transcription factor [Bacillota bacterium]